jgi:hypothetical protein
MPKRIKLSGVVIALAVIAVLYYFVYLVFITPAFYDPDSYYHIALSRLIKEHGLRYPFTWAQFSVFKDSFSDKDILFHLLNLPFLSFSDNPVTSGKYALLFHSAMFLLAYLFVLRRYLPKALAALFLLLPFTSPVFLVYLLQLRSVTFANALTLLGVYFLIKKRPVWVFIIALLSSLAHISFFMILILACVCEALRRLLDKEFFVKNICAAAAGIILGCFIHPNFPHNFLSLYLNGFLVTWYGIIGNDLGFSGELQTLGSRAVFACNFAVFLGLGVMFWMALFSKRKAAGFATAVWFAAATIYLLLAFSGNRYWYQANPLFFVSFASFLRDWTEKEGWNDFARRFKLQAAFCLLLILLFLPGASKMFKESLDLRYADGLRLEKTGRWMAANIPAGKTIYHSYWAQSPYFICFNPKDNYINVLDPIYMFYRYPREFELLDDLSLGRVYRPYVAIRKVFRAEYGYVNKVEPLYRQLRDYPANFKIIYEDSEGVVFQVILG